MTRSEFLQQLEWGKEGEKEICNLLAEQGESFMALYQFEDDIAPKIMGAEGDIISPDIIRFSNGRAYFAEVKRKTQWVKGWSVSGEIETGLNNKHFLEYVKTSKITGLDVEIYFIQEEMAPLGIWKYTIKPNYNGEDCNDELQSRRIGDNFDRRTGKNVKMTYFRIGSLQKIK